MMTQIKSKNQNSGDALKTELNVLEHLLVRQGTNLTSKPQKPKSENYLAIVNTTKGGNDKKPEGGAAIPFSKPNVPRALEAS
jgi:hypothetical protein